MAHAVARETRRYGIDVITPVDAGLRGAMDSAYLERGVSERRVVVTTDHDFTRLH